MEYLLEVPGSHVTGFLALPRHCKRRTTVGTQLGLRVRMQSAPAPTTPGCQSTEDFRRLPIVTDVRCVATNTPDTERRNQTKLLSV